MSGEGPYLQRVEMRGGTWFARAVEITAGGEAVARDPRLFTYLADSPASTHVCKPASQRSSSAEAKSPAAATSASSPV